MSQKEQVLQLLTEAGDRGVSSNEFFRRHLPRFSARIHELKAEGYLIEKEPIDAGFFLYKLAADPPPLITSGNTAVLDVPQQTTSGAVGDQKLTATSLPRDGSTGFSCDGDSPGGPTSGSSYYDWEEAA